MRIVLIIGFVLLIGIGAVTYMWSTSSSTDLFEQTFESMRLELSNDSRYVDNGSLKYGYRDRTIGFDRNTDTCLLRLIGFQQEDSCTQIRALYFFESNTSREQPYPALGLLSMRQRDTVHAVISYRSARDADRALDEAEAYFGSEFFDAVRADENRSRSENGAYEVTLEPGRSDLWPESWPALPRALEYRFALNESTVVYSARAVER